MFLNYMLRSSRPACRQTSHFEYAHACTQFLYQEINKVWSSSEVEKLKDRPESSSTLSTHKLWSINIPSRSN